MGSLPKFNQTGTNSQLDIQVHQPGLFYTNYMGTTQNKDFSTANRYHISKKCIYKYLLITTKLLDQNPNGDPNLPYSLQNFGVHVDNFSQCTQTEFHQYEFINNKFHQYEFYTYSTKIHTSGIRTSGDRTSGGPPVQFYQDETAQG